MSVAQFAQVLEAVAKRSDVRISFDDGNASDVEVALPRLVDLTAEFFLPAEMLGDLQPTEGRPTSRVSIVALLQPSRRVRELAT